MSKYSIEIEGICDALGIMEKELAAMLGISKALLSLYKKGERGLTLPASIRLNKMNDFLALPVKEEIMEEWDAERQQIALAKYYQKYLEDLQFEKLKLERQLVEREGSTKKNAQGRRLFSFTEYMLQQGDKSGYLKAEKKNKVMEATVLIKNMAVSKINVHSLTAQAQENIPLENINALIELHLKRMEVKK